MEKVVKVSIGNSAFTLEEKGYALVKSYLDDINNHYWTKENGSEIIEGIEERMAELIMERSGAGVVVSMTVIQEVITLLGKPDDFDEAGKTERVKVKKRLYRDPGNRLLGGVCSGIAAYFNMDVVWVRLLFIVLFLLLSSFGWLSYLHITFFHFSSAKFIVLAYIILWIVIPKAKTMEQRCAMYGESVDLSNIQERVQGGYPRAGAGGRSVGREPALSWLGRLILNVMGVLFVVIAVVGLIVHSLLFLGMEIAWGMFPFEVLDYVRLGIENPDYIKMLLMAVLILPLIGMLYIGIRMLFRFKSPRWRPGLVIFLLWIVSGFSFVALSVKASRPFWGEARYSRKIELKSSVDTLYIDLVAPTPLPASKVFFSADKAHYRLFWVDGSRKGRTLTTYPSIYITRGDSLMEKKIFFYSYASSSNDAEAYIKAEKIVPSLTLTDSLLVIYPNVYTKERKWDGVYGRIFLHLPPNVHVVVRGPVKHHFNRVIRQGKFNLPALF